MSGRADAAVQSRSAKAFEAYLFLAPFLLLYLVLLIYPLGKGIWISLYDWDLLSARHSYVGFANYANLWNDDLFWTCLRNTLVFVALTVPSMTALALALALAVNRPGWLRGTLRGVFFATSVFSVSVVTLVWQMVLNGDRGLLAHLFTSLGLKPIGFLSDVVLAMPSLTVTTLWWSIGLPMALFLASLQQIPPELFEAAELDHATRWKILRRITLPAIQRTTVLVLVLQLVAQFQMFGQSDLMTKGGPADSTRSLVQYIYETGFRDWQIGYAAAIAAVLFCIMLGLSMLQLWLGREAD